MSELTEARVQFCAWMLWNGLGAILGGRGCRQVGSWPECIRSPGRPLLLFLRDGFLCGCSKTYLSNLSPQLFTLQVMESFVQDRTKRSRKAMLDRYEIQTEATKDKVITMESISFAEYSTSKEAIQYYIRGAGLITIGLLTSAITYPLAVRIAKKVFRLTDVLNIHMAVVPIVMNTNALTLGIAQGFINHYLLTKKYPTRPQDAEMAFL